MLVTPYIFICKNYNFPCSRLFFAHRGLTVALARATTRASSGTSSVMVPPAAR